MGALTPLFLLAGVAVAVPIWLHLFQRQEVRRLSFPALRYLERTEREHARRIRLRQILLLLARVSVVLFLVGGGARLFLRGEGSAHPPTALAIVLDNSLSSGRVVGEARALDHLRALALRTLDAATEDDRIWVVRAGEPWRPAVPTTPAEARRVIEETEVSDAAGDLSAALERAADLVATSPLPAREVHLLSDLQASGFDPAVATPAGDVPVVVWAAPDEVAPANRALVAVEVGGGLPPLAGQRTEVALRAAPAAGDDTASVPVRVVIGEQVRGAGFLPPGASLVLPLPSAQAGWVTGYADADPDELRGDDRRWFAYRVRPAPGVAVVGAPGVFLEEAIEVLRAGGRIRSAPVREADAVVSSAGEGLAEVGAGRGVLVLPPADATQLPSLNRRLQDAGIPWRLERGTSSGSAVLEADALPDVLEGVEVRDAYRLVLAGDPESAPRTLARAGGEPWAVEGRDQAGRRYLILASPLDEAATTLPVSSGMIRFVDWFAGDWAAIGAGGGDRLAGTPLSAPRGAERVRLPSGTELPLDATRMVRETGSSGLYAFLAGDSVLAWEAVNASPAESDLVRLSERALEGAVGRNVTIARREGAWEDAIFLARRGPELARALALAALALLLLEAMLAATGRRSRGPRAAATGGEVHAGS